MIEWNPTTELGKTWYYFEHFWWITKKIVVGKKIVPVHENIYEYLFHSLPFHNTGGSIKSIFSDSLVPS